MELIIIVILLLIIIYLVYKNIRMKMELYNLYFAEEMDNVYGNAEQNMMMTETPQAKMMELFNPLIYLN